LFKLEGEGVSKTTAVPIVGEIMAKTAVSDYWWIIRKVTSDTEFVGDVFKNIPLDKIRTDPSWLKTEIMENRTEDLTCFLNVNVFNRIVANFIKEEWEPLCFDLLNDASKLLIESADQAINGMDNISSRYPKLVSLMQLKCSDISKRVSEIAKIELVEHLDMETFPYTQDHYLFEIIAKKRTKRLEEEILSALTASSAAIANIVSTTKYIQSSSADTMIKGIFHRNQRMPIEDHMAEDMEVFLEAYGKVCYKRIVDKSPMIFQKMLRPKTVCDLVCEEMKNITDKDIEHVMADEPDFKRKNEEAKNIL